MLHLQDIATTRPVTLIRAAQLRFAVLIKAIFSSPAAFFFLSPSSSPRLHGISAHLLAIGLLMFIASLLQAQQQQINRQADSLISELGCAGCHSSLTQKHALAKRIPDLREAGKRYQTGYLFRYLQQPQSVRRHLGAARMPDFHLSEAEALALTLYLLEQQQMPAELAEVSEKMLQRPAALRRISDAPAFSTFLTRQTTCLSCHIFGSSGTALAVDMAALGQRLQPQWIKSFLVSPALFSVPAEVMPPQFYQHSPDTSPEWTELAPGATERLLRLVDYLDHSSAARRFEQEQVFEGAKARYSEVDAALGGRIFAALNCAGCHMAPVQAASGQAPDLAIEGLRVQSGWLRNYLQKPQPIRPAGHSPGDGGRMPDFRLDSLETAVLADYLLRQRRLPRGDGLADYTPIALSPFARQKARDLLQNKLACLGCHQFDGQGGRIGPDLTSAGTRLQPDYIAALLENPQHLLPQSIMPKQAMPMATRQLLASFLSIRRPVAVTGGYLPLTTLRSQPRNGTQTAAGLYADYCSSCHGSSGGGDGFNAPFLPAPPTLHADSAFMSTRADDTLFDGIANGGYILNKHHFMPGWSDLLNAAEMRRLQAYLRELCRCRQPGWADQPNAGAGR